MRRTLNSVIFLGLASLPFACGGGIQPAPKEPTAVAVGAEPASVTHTELTPAGEPDDLVLAFRWKNPSSVADTLKAWAGFPQADALVGSLVDGLFDKGGFSSVVNLNAPVGVAVALSGAKRNRGVLFGFSIGLRSSQDAKNLGAESTVQERPDGSFRMAFEIAGEDFVCTVTRSLGPASNSLVCGPSDKDIDVLGPYLSRGLPVANFPDKDFYGEVRFAPVKAKYGPEIQRGIEMGSLFLSNELGGTSPTLNRALSEAFLDGGKEIAALLKDADKLHFAAQLDKNATEYTAEIGFSFNSRNSWISRRFFDNEDQAGSAPPLFWAVPSDSESAFYGRGLKSSDFESIRRHTGNLLDGWLATFPGVTATDRMTAVDLVVSSFETTPVVVSAKGTILPKAAQGASKVDKFRDAVTAMLGWQVTGMEETHHRTDKWMNDLTRLYNRPTVQKWIRDKFVIKATEMPKVTYGPLKANGLPGLKAMQISVPATLLDVTAKGAKPLVGYFMLLPDGNRTWIAVGMERDVLEKQLKSIKNGGSSSIESKAGLDELRSGNHVNGGFMSIAALSIAAGSGMFLEDVGSDADEYLVKIAETLSELSRLPNRGSTPILVTRSAKEGNPSVATVQLKVQSGTIVDLRALITALVGQKSKFLRQ